MDKHRFWPLLLGLVTLVVMLVPGATRPRYAEAYPNADWCIGNYCLGVASWDNPYWRLWSGILISGGGIYIYDQSQPIPPEIKTWFENSSQWDDLTKIGMSKIKDGVDSQVPVNIMDTDISTIAAANVDAWQSQWADRALPEGYTGKWIVNPGPGTYVEGTFGNPGGLYPNFYMYYHRVPGFTDNRACVREVTRNGVVVSSGSWGNIVSGPDLWQFLQINSAYGVAGDVFRVTFGACSGNGNLAVWLRDTSVTTGTGTVVEPLTFYAGEADNFWQNDAFLVSTPPDSASEVGVTPDMIRGGQVGWATYYDLPATTTAVWQGGLTVTATHNAQLTATAVANVTATAVAQATPTVTPNIALTSTAVAQITATARAIATATARAHATETAVVNVTATAAAIATRNAEWTAVASATRAAQQTQAAQGTATATTWEATATAAARATGTAVAQMTATAQATMTPTDWQAPFRPEELVDLQRTMLTDLLVPKRGIPERLELLRQQMYLTFPLGLLPQLEVCTAPVFAGGSAGVYVTVPGGSLGEFTIPIIPGDWAGGARALSRACAFGLLLIYGFTVGRRFLSGGGN